MVGGLKIWSRHFHTSAFCKYCLKACQYITKDRWCYKGLVVYYDGHKSSAELGGNASDVYQSENSELGLDEQDLEGLGRCRVRWRR